MQATINKPRLTAAALLIIAGNLAVLLFGPPNVGSVKPQHPASVLFTDSLLIAIGVGIQVWTRDKPRYKSIGLLAYFLTLVMCGALSFGLMASLMGRFF